MAWAPSLGFFVAGLLMYGLTSSVMAPLNTYIQGARGKWSVGRAVSFVSSAYNVGGILGPILGGLLGGLTNLRIVYFISAGVFAISTIVILYAGDQTIEKVPHMEGDGHLLQNKRFLGMLGIILLLMFAVILPQPLASNFLQNQRKLSLNQIGQLGSLGALGSVLIMLIFGQLPVHVALVIGQAGVMLFSLFLWQGTGMLWFGLGHFFLGGFRLCRAMTVALVRPVVREREVGLAFGIVESLNSLAMVAAPILAGFLYQWNPISIFPLSLAVLFITITITVLLTRNQKGFHFGGQYVEPKEMDEDA
jgi:MFS family permease